MHEVKLPTVPNRSRGSFLEAIASAMAISSVTVSATLTACCSFIDFCRLSYSAISLRRAAASARFSSLTSSNRFNESSKSLISSCNSFARGSLSCISGVKLPSNERTSRFRSRSICLQFSSACANSSSQTASVSLARSNGELSRASSSNSSSRAMFFCDVLPDRTATRDFDRAKQPKQDVGASSSSDAVSDASSSSSSSVVVASSTNPSLCANSSANIQFATRTGVELSVPSGNRVCGSTLLL